MMMMMMMMMRLLFLFLFLFLLLAVAGGIAELLRHYESFGLCLEPDANDLVCRMIDADIGSRITTQGIRSHPWVVTHTVQGEGTNVAP
jgi:hypothetical protein